MRIIYILGEYDVKDKILKRMVLELLRELNTTHSLTKVNILDAANETGVTLSSLQSICSPYLAATSPPHSIGV
jgi:hypothetical protein